MITFFHFLPIRKRSEMGWEEKRNLCRNSIFFSKQDGNIAPWISTRRTFRLGDIESTFGVPLRSHGVSTAVWCKKKKKAQIAAKGTLGYHRDKIWLFTPILFFWHETIFNCEIRVSLSGRREKANLGWFTENIVLCGA